MDAVIISVMALITNKKSPSVTMVTGSVNIIKSGLISTFKIDKMRLAIIAAPMLLIWMESIYPSMTINNNALTKMLTAHLPCHFISLSDGTIKIQMI